MEIKDQKKLISQSSFFKPLLNKAMIRISELLLDKFQLIATRTKPIHTKLYNYALNFSKRGIVTDQEMNSCIMSLLDDVDYIDPSDSNNDNQLCDSLFNKIKADYLTTFHEDDLTSTEKYLSWIERIAGYQLGDEN